MHVDAAQGTEAPRTWKQSKITRDQSGIREQATQRHASVLVVISVQRSMRVHLLREQRRIITQIGNARVCFPYGDFRRGRGEYAGDGEARIP